MVLNRPLGIFNGFWGNHHHWMCFGSLTIAINGFSMVFGPATIAFNGFRWFYTIGQTMRWFRWIAMVRFGSWWLPLVRFPNSLGCELGEQRAYTRGIELPWPIVQRCSKMLFSFGLFLPVASKGLKMLKMPKSKTYGAISQIWSLKSGNGCFGLLTHKDSGCQVAGFTKQYVAF